MADDEIENALLVFDEEFTLRLLDGGWEVGARYKDWTTDEKDAARSAMRAAIKAIGNRRA